MARWRCWCRRRRRRWWTRRWRWRCFDDEATAATDALLGRAAAEGVVVPALWFLEVANALLTAFDAAYLEPAIRRGLPLATLDEDLRRAGEAAGVPLL